MVPKSRMICMYMVLRLLYILVISRLFIYYNERKIENTIDSDSGASLRDGIKTIHNIGVCKEDDWVRPRYTVKFKV